MAEKRNILDCQSKVINNTKKTLAEVLNIKVNQIQIGHNFKENQAEISVKNFKPNNDQTALINKTKDYLQTALTSIV